jgi:hypothetical protein
MPRPPIDLHQKAREILAHVNPLPAEAGAPLAHYNRSSTDIWSLVSYVERNFGQLPLQPAAVRRHMGRLHGMILVNLVENVRLRAFSRGSRRNDSALKKGSICEVHADIGG